MDALEIDRMLTVSAAHLCAETRGELPTPSDWMAPRSDAIPATAFPFEYGCFLYVPKEEALMDGEGEMPLDLAALYAFAREHGCTWIKLDRDGPLYDGLTMYED